MTIPSRGEVQLVSSSTNKFTCWGIEVEGILRTFFFFSFSGAYM